MSPTTPEYDAILARKMREREEGDKGSFTGKGGEVFDYKISPDGKKVTIQGTDRGAKYLTGEPIQLPEALQPKRKRGRPKGSKNRPKVK